MANYITMRKLGYNDHGRVHAFITGAASLAITELMLEAGVKTDIMESGVGDAEDVFLTVILGTMLHDIGNQIHRVGHEGHGVALALPILDRIMGPLYADPFKRAKIRGLYSGGHQLSRPESGSADPGRRHRGRGRRHRHHQGPGPQGLQAGQRGHPFHQCAGRGSGGDRAGPQYACADQRDHEQFRRHFSGGRSPGPQSHPDAHAEIRGTPGHHASAGRRADSVAGAAGRRPFCDGSGERRKGGRGGEGQPSPEAARALADALDVGVERK